MRYSPGHENSKEHLALLTEEGCLPVPGRSINAGGYPDGKGDAAMAMFTPSEYMLPEPGMTFQPTEDYLHIHYSHPDPWAAPGDPINVDRATGDWRSISLEPPGPSSPAAAAAKPMRTDGAGADSAAGQGPTAAHHMEVDQPLVMPKDEDMPKNK